MAALGIVSLATGISEAVMLTLLADIAAAMVLKSHLVHADLGFVRADVGLGKALVTAIMITAGRAFLQLLVAWFPARIAAQVQADLRIDLSDAFAKASWSEKSTDSEGHFQELMTDQVNNAVGAVMNTSTLIASGAMFVALVASAFSLSTIAAMVMLASATALFVAFRPVDRAGGRAARASSQAYMDQASGISEAVRLAEEAEVFGASTAYHQRLGELVRAACSSSFKASFTLRLVGSLYQSAIYLIILGGAGIIYLVHAGNLASLGAIVLLLVRAASYGQQLQGANHALVQAAPYIERLQGSIDRYRSSAPPSGREPLSAIQSVAMDKVSYSYKAGRPVLHDISFEVRSGETIGIIGPTGAGKSTLSQLLLRLREPTEGQYLINGRPSGSLDRSDWQRKVAYVPQEPRLLRGTVSDNIRFFRDISQAEIERAARLAHIHDDVMAMANGYWTIVGQQADAVSGGQRQRLCLARALAGRPGMLLLDEPTSALDLASELAVQESLADLCGQITIFVIAHRLSVLRICDRVLVLEEGRLSTFATLDELERTDRFYQRVSSLVSSGPPGL